jgi:membrane AbrB-like protein
VLSIVETEQLDMVRRLPGDLYSTAATLGAAALIGLVFDRLRMPGGFLLGGLLGSGTVHFFDWASGSLPNAVLIAGFIVLGGAIGSRFSGNTVRTLGAVFVTASAVIAIGFGISLVLAFGMSLVVGRSFAELTLAFSPGAIDVTAVLAFSLGLDSVFVAAHQLFRFCLIAATLSAGGWWFARDRKDDEETP